MHITSTSNPRIANAARLRQAKGRRQQNRIIIDGLREIHRASQAGVQLIEVYSSDVDLIPEELARDLQRRDVEVVSTTSQVFEKLAYGNRNENLVAIAERPQRELANLPHCEFVAVVEGLEKPGNLGGIMRSADAAGVEAVVCADSVCEIYNPNAIRASLGAIFTVPLVAASSEEAHQWLVQNQFAIFAAKVDGAQDYDQCDLHTSPTAIVLGSEADGLRSSVWDNIAGIQIPMAGIVDSLNVSVAAAILFFEVRRQRHVHS